MPCLFPGASAVNRTEIDDHIVHFCWPNGCPRSLDVPLSGRKYRAAFTVVARQVGIFSLLKIPSLMALSPIAFYTHLGSQIMKILETPRPFTAYQGSDDYLFICFSHRDSQKVYSDIDWLHESGLNIWYDEGISAGHLWREDIANAIDQCSLFVVFLSETAVVSDNCRKEVNYALEAGKPFLAIYLENVTLSPGISLAIGEIQGVLRYSDPPEEYRRKVLGYLKENLGKEISLEDSRLSKPRKSHWGLQVLLPVMLLALAGTLWLSQTSWKPKETVTTSDFVFMPRGWVLLVFNNHTNNTMFEGSLETALRVSLNDSAYMNLFSRGRTRDSLRRMGRPETTKLDEFLGMEIAQREGMAAVVETRIEQEGDKYSLSMKVVNPKTQLTVFSHSVKANTEAELLPKLSLLADTLRMTLGEPAESIHSRDVTLQRATTANLAALRIYSNAIETAYTVSLEETIDQLEQALLLDPDFALAHAKIATYMLAVDGDKSLAQSHFEAATSNMDRLSQREQLYVEAAQAWLETPEKMERRWRLMAQVYPDEISAQYNLGAIRWEYYNDFSGAIAHFRAALEIEPDNGAIFHSLGYCLLAIGETEESLSAFEKARNLAGMTSGLADAYTVIEDYQSAEEILVVNDQLTPGQQIPRITRLISVALDQNFLESAFDLAVEGLRFAENTEAYRSAVGFSGARLAISTRLDTVQFNQELESTIKIVFRLIDENKISSMPTRELALIGKLAARNGQLSTAQQLVDFIAINDDYEENPMSEDYAGLLGAEIAMAEGDLDTAEQLFELIIARSNLFQAHEGLARVLSLNGYHVRELTETQWIYEHKGQALAQMSETVMGREMNLISWRENANRLQNTP